MWSKRILPKAKSIGASCGAPAIVAALLLFGAPAPTRAANPYSLTSVLRKSGPVRSGLIRIPGLKASTPYSLLLSIRTPRVFGSDSRVIVDLKQGGAELLHKTLHLGDPDFYALFHVPKNGRAELSLEVTNLDGPATYLLQVNRWPRNRSLEEEPNDRWEDANPIALGHTVFGTADDVPYIPVPGTNAGAALEGNTGVDWFRFEFTEARPKLVLFQVDLLDRDNIPVDVAVFRVQRGRPVPYTEGEDPVALPHEVQALPGNKFLTRILRGSGTYYIRYGPITLNTSCAPGFTIRRPTATRVRRCRPPSITSWARATPGMPIRPAVAACGIAWPTCTRKPPFAWHAIRLTFRSARSFTPSATAMPCIRNKRSSSWPNVSTIIGGRFTVSKRTAPCGPVLSRRQPTC